MELVRLVGWVKSHFTHVELHHDSTCALYCQLESGVVPYLGVCYVASLVLKEGDLVMCLQALDAFG